MHTKLNDEVKGKVGTPLVLVGVAVVACLVAVVALIIAGN